MCDFTGRLIAWMDGELAQNDAAMVDRHVRDCADCRKRVSAYEEVSHGFAAYYAVATKASVEPIAQRKIPRWVPVLAATLATAAALLLALMPRSSNPVPPAPRVAEARLVSDAEPAVTTIQPVHRRHVIARKKVPSSGWAMAGPAIQIAIPADAMFPPGAVPEGFTYVANLSLTDGSVQGLRPQP